MSLRVWLPLNGTLDNQGLDDIVVTNNGATVDNSGKIGKCYSFDGNDDYISLTGNCLYNIIKGGTSSFSISFWIYQVDSTRAIIFGDYGLTGGIGFNIELTTSHVVRFYWNGSPDLNISQINVGTTTWNHIVLVYDTTHLYGYLNGILVYTHTGALAVKNKISGSYYLGRDSRTGNTVLNGKINDFRIYDHALSPMEVKQISQGLILHYPLNNNGFGQENLLIDTLKDQDNTHSTYNISDYNFSEHLVEGEKYTITASVTTSSEKTFVGMYHSGGSYSMSGWMKVNENGFYQKTFTATANMANRTQGIGYGFCRVYVSNNPSGGQSSYTLAGTANVNWIKIEKGIKATPWGPNKADILYNDNIEYDCSGYQKNGEKIGINYSSDTPKYDVSSVFSASPSVIKIPNQHYAIQGSQNMTISVWAYKEDWSQYSERIYSCTEGGGLNIQLSSNNMSWAVNVYIDAEKTSHKYASSSPDLYIRVPRTDFSSGWHMFTWVYTTSGTLLYVDGVLKQSKTGTSYGLYFHSTAPLILGGQATSTNYSSPYLDGKLSDFRIYVTALSAEDILALYKNSVYIDNEGNLYGAELKEV